MCLHSGAFWTKGEVHVLACIMIAAGSAFRNSSAFWKPHVGTFNAPVRASKYIVLFVKWHSYTFDAPHLASKSELGLTKWNFKDWLSEYCKLKDRGSVRANFCGGVCVCACVCECVCVIQCHVV
jgi:hypothetical protein